MVGRRLLVVLAEGIRSLLSRIYGIERLLEMCRRMTSLRILTTCCCCADVLSTSLGVEILPMRRTGVGFPLSPTDEVMRQRPVYVAVHTISKEALKCTS